MTEKLPPPPLERIFDLADLSESGTEITLAPSKPDLEKLAPWVEVEAIEKLEAIITLKRTGQSRFLYKAHLTADVVQNCVVTLEPLRAHIDRTFERVLMVVRHARHPEHSGEVSLGEAAAEAPEEIESSRFDIAGPVLEELTLAIDPYPRSPGAAFDPPESAASPPPESPFSVLGKLKGGA